MNKKALFPGTFDPFTNGHLDVVERSQKIFDRIVIVIVDNKQKKSFFTLQQREEMILQVIQDNLWENVEVIASSKMMYEICSEQDIYTIVRGIRDEEDFIYEKRIDYFNKTFDDRIETFFLVSNVVDSYTRSTHIRELLMYHQDVSKFVPDAINKYIEEL